MKLPPCIAPQQALSALWGRVPRHIRITFPAALIVGFATHGYMLANKFINHDDLAALFGTGYGTASGRWLLPYILGLDGQISAPWLIGTLCLLLLAASACLAVSILRLRSPVSCVLAAAIMVTFPTVTATLAYMFTASAYMLGLLLACLAAYLTLRFRRGFAGGALALTLSLGIYQSYLAVTAVLLVAAMILETLDGRIPLKKLLVRCARMVAVLVLALLLYFAMVQLTMPQDGLADYMGISSMGQISPAQLPRLVRDAYTRYSQLYKVGAPAPISPVLPALIVLALAAGAVLALAILRRLRPKLPRLALLAVLVAVFPLAGGLVYVMAPNADIHQLMLYGTCFMLLAPLCLLEYHAALPGADRPGLPAGLAAWTVVVCLALTAFQYGIFANGAYTKMQLSGAQLSAYSTRLVAAIETSPHYTRQVEIALVYSTQSMVELMPALEPLQDIKLIGVLSAEELLKSYICQQYFTHYMAFPNRVYVSAGNARARQLAALPQVADMPCYPQAGCMALVEGCLVVKLSP